MKKTFLGILGIGVIAIMALSLAPMTVVAVAPKSAAAGAIDFNVSGAASFNYVKKSLYIQALVLSASGSDPTTVIACVNGTNMTLTPEYYDLSGVYVGKNTSLGRNYFTWICNPAEGNYQIKFYADNSSGSATSFGNATPTVSYDSVKVTSSGRTNLRANENLFYVEASKLNCSTTLEVVVTIDGTNHTLVYNNLTARYEYIHDFGWNNDTKHFYNFTLVTNGQPMYIMLGAGTFFWASFTPQISALGIPGINIPAKRVKTSAGANESWILMYQSWQDVAPTNWTLEINGVNKTISLGPDLDAAKMAALGAFGGSVKKCNTSLSLVNYRDGVNVGYVELSLTNATTYNVTVHCWNGSAWNSVKIYNNVTVCFMNPTITYGILNNEFFIKDGQWWYNFSINVTYTGIDSMNFFAFQWLLLDASIRPFSIMGGILTPDELNPADTNYADGKIYYYLDAIAPSYMALWGDWQISFGSLFMMTPSQIYNAPTVIDFWTTDTIIKSSGVVGANGTYSIVSDDFLIYDSTETYGNCCNAPENSSMRQLIKFNFVGKKLNSDVFDYDLYFWDPCYKAWLKFDFGKMLEMQGIGLLAPALAKLSVNGSMRLWLEPTKALSWFSSGLTVMPKNANLTLLANALNALTETGLYKADVSKGTLTKSLIVNNCYKETESMTVNKDGIITDMTTLKIWDGCYYEKIGMTFIVKGHGALPKDDGSSLLGIDGFSSVLVIGLGIMSIGLVYIYSKRRVH